MTRTMTRMIRILLLLVLVLSSTVGAEEILELRFELVQSEAEQADQTIPLTVHLGNTWLEIQEPTERTRYDFWTKRRTLSNKGRTRQDSLYSAVGFRSAELKNRLRLREGLNQAKVDHNVFGSPMQLEHLFSLFNSESSSPEQRSQGSQLQYFTGQDLLAEHSLDGAELNSEQAQSYVKFLRYRFGGHPVILNDIEKRQSIPKRLKLLQYNMGKSKTRELLFLSQKMVSEVSAFPEKSEPPPESLASLCRRVEVLGPKEVLKKHEATRNHAKESFAKGEHFIASLHYFEDMLSTGKGFDSSFMTNKDTFVKDPDTQAMIRALSPKSREEAEQYNKILKDLESRSGGASHVLKIFRSGHLLGLGQKDESQKLLLQALRANPTISSAWKDLGDIYYAQFRMEDAWLCWDVGRQLAPHNAHFDKVRGLEKSLLAEYPEYF